MCGVFERNRIPRNQRILREGDKRLPDSDVDETSGTSGIVCIAGTSATSGTSGTIGTKGGKSIVMARTSLRRTAFDMELLRRSWSFKASCNPITWGS